MCNYVVDTEGGVSTFHSLPRHTGKADPVLKTTKPCSSIPVVSFHPHIVTPLLQIVDHVDDLTFTDFINIIGGLETMRIQTLTSAPLPSPGSPEMIGERLAWVRGHKATLLFLGGQSLGKIEITDAYTYVFEENSGEGSTRMIPSSVRNVHTYPVDTTKREWSRDRA